MKKEAVSSGSSAEVAHQAEDRRANLAHTLDQLRENLKPENVVDEVMTNAKFGAANLVDGLWKAARQNPVPALLIGAGLALILGLGAGRRNSGRGSDDGLGSSLPPGGNLRPGSTLAAAKSELAAAAGNVGALAAALKDEVVDHAAAGAAAANAAAARTAAGKAAAALPHTIKGPMPVAEVMPWVAPRSPLGWLLDEKPLILGAAGLAVGAAIAAALPTTRTEEDWLGETSASVKHAAQGAAQAQFAELKAAAGRAVDHVKQAATDHGLSADNLNGLVRDVGSHAKTAVHEFGDSFETAKRAS